MRDDGGAHESPIERRAERGGARKVRGDVCECARGGRHGEPAVRERAHAYGSRGRYRVFGLERDGALVGVAAEAAGGERAPGRGRWGRRGVVPEDDEEGGEGEGLVCRLGDGREELVKVFLRYVLSALSSTSCCAEDIPG